MNVGIMALGVLIFIVVIGCDIDWYRRFKTTYTKEYGGPIILYFLGAMAITFGAIIE